MPNPNLEDQVLSFVWSLSHDLLDMVGPANDFVTVDIAHRVLETHVTATGEDKVTALHLSARYKKPESTHDSVIQYLVQKKADVNAEDEYGSTPLHYAAIKGNVVRMKELLRNKNIKLEAEDKEKITPLHLACSYGNVECCRLLIVVGNINLRCLTDENRTPFHFASREGHLNICELLFSKANGTEKEMLTDKDFEGNTALHLAVKNGHHGIVKFCLKNGSDVNARDQNSRTPLHLAAALPNTNIVNILLDNGARVNVLDKSRSSPLHIACMYNRKDVADCLIGKSCYNISIKNKKDLVEESDKYDDTPLHVAAKKGYIRIVKLADNVINSFLNGRYGRHGIGFLEDSQVQLIVISELMELEFMAVDELSEW
ncbi:serine/threonine-protein phosphatase 6 regulatory ankyrin repeat subunit C-like [Ptychodera flava]|uniref:serine/threonine-protein phosphatase 6 regulatory ankyrin repeat subunit C-like n=1 Tax=Ptychodera flava TaxID=63121 RepID=UPI003969F2C1